MIKVDVSFRVFVCLYSSFEGIEGIFFVRHLWIETDLIIIELSTNKANLIIISSVLYNFIFSFFSTTK